MQQDFTRFVVSTIDDQARAVIKAVGGHTTALMQTSELNIEMVTLPTGRVEIAKGNHTDTHLIGYWMDDREGWLRYHGHIDITKTHLELALEDRYGVEEPVATPDDSSHSQEQLIHEAYRLAKQHGLQISPIISSGHPERLLGYHIVHDLSSGHFSPEQAQDLLDEVERLVTLIHR